MVGLGLGLDVWLDLRHGIMRAIRPAEQYELTD